MTDCSYDDGVCAASSAARFSDLEMLEYVIENSPNLENPDDIGKNVIESAAMSGDLEKLEYLHFIGCQYYGMTIGINAIISGKYDVVKYVYKNFSKGLDHDENFRLAILRGEFDIAELIYKKGDLYHYNVTNIYFDKEDVKHIEDVFSYIANWLRKIGHSSFI